MKTVTIQINDLFEFEGQPAPTPRPGADVIATMARRQFEFLRQPLQIEVGDRTVTITFAEESTRAQDEASRLAERASKRAAEGSYDKATSGLRRLFRRLPRQRSAETGTTIDALNRLRLGLQPEK